MLTRLPLALIVTVAIMATVASAWSGPSWYAKSYNISVIDWNFTGPGNFIYPATYALVTLTGIGDPTYSTIYGFRNGQFIGSIPFYVVRSGNNQSVLLLSQYTNESSTWTNASIYYDNLYENVAPYTVLAPYTSYGQRYGYGLQSDVASYSYANQSVTIYATNTLIGGGSCQTCFTPFYSNSINFWMNIQYLTSTPGFSTSTDYMTVPAVLVSNRTLINRNLTIRWWPVNPSLDTPTIEYVLNTTSSAYAIGSINAFSAGKVTSPYVSDDSNTIFGSNGLTVWLYGTGNQIESNGMSRYCSYQCFLYNTTTTKYTGFTGIYPKSDKNVMQFNITANAPTHYAILPSFTATYSNTIPVQNPNPNTNVTGSSTFYNGFQLYMPINNINWKFSYLSYATGNSLAPPFYVNYTKGKVGFEVLQFPHFNSTYMGSYCQGVQVYAVNGNTILGQVPFSIVNCTPANVTARIVIQNTTLNDLTFNAVQIYYDPLGGAQYAPSYSNSIVYSNWRVGYGNTVTVAATWPVLAVLQHPLNVRSYIYTGTPQEWIGPGIGWTLAFNSTIDPPYVTGSFLQFLGSGYSNGHITDTNGYTNSTFLFSNLSYVYTRGLALEDDSGTVTIYNNSNSLVTIGQTFTGYSNVNATIYENGNIAMYRLYGFAISNGQSIATGVNSTLPKLGIPNVTTSIPQTQNSLSNVTTTIIIPANALTVTLAPGVSLPQWALISIAIVLMLISLGLISNEELGWIGVAVMLIGAWMLSIYQIELLPLSVLITIIAIAYEYIERKSNRGESP